MLSLGILTILSITSAFALTRCVHCVPRVIGDSVLFDSFNTDISLRRRCRKIRPTAFMLSITILALFTSTTIYVVTSILECQAYFLESFLYSYGSVWSSSPALNIAFLDIPAQPNLNLDAPSRVKQCTSAAALTVNVGLC